MTVPSAGGTLAGFLRRLPIPERVRRSYERCFPASRPMLGVDLGHSAVKVVELAPSPGGGWTVVRFGIQALAADADRAGLAAALRGVCRQARVSDARVISALTGPDVMVRYIDLPRMSPAEVRSAIHFEAEKYLPFKVEDLALDGQILEELPTSRQVRVLLVAAKRGAVAEHLEVLSAAGLESQVIDVDALAVANAFAACQPAEQQAGTYALVHVGGRCTSIHIVDRGISRFTRDLAVAGDDCTRAVAESLKLSFDEAERLKHDPQERASDVAAAVRPVVDNLVAEIRLSFNYFERDGERPVERVFLSGGGALLAGLETAVHDHLDLPVSHWQPPADRLSVAGGDRAEAFAQLGGRLVVALGLALRGTP